MKGNQVARNLKNALDILNISTTDDIIDSNVSDYSIVYE